MFWVPFAKGCHVSPNCLMGSQLGSLWVHNPSSGTLFISAKFLAKTSFGPKILSNRLFEGPSKFLTILALFYLFAVNLSDWWYSRLSMILVLILYDMISQQASSRPAEVFLAGQVEDFVFYCEQNISMFQFQYNYRAYTRYLILWKSYPT